METRRPRGGGRREEERGQGAGVASASMEQDTRVRARTYTHAHARTHARPHAPSHARPHDRTHDRKQARTYTRARARARAHTHTHKHTGAGLLQHPGAQVYSDDPRHSSAAGCAAAGSAAGRAGELVEGEVEAGADTDLEDVARRQRQRRRLRGGRRPGGEIWGARGGERLRVPNAGARRRRLRTRARPLCAGGSSLRARLRACLRARVRDHYLLQVMVCVRARALARLRACVCVWGGKREGGPRGGGPLSGDQVLAAHAAGRDRRQSARALRPAHPRDRDRRSQAQGRKSLTAEDRGGSPRLECGRFDRASGATERSCSGTRVSESVPVQEYLSLVVSESRSIRVS